MCVNPSMSCQCRKQATQASSAAKHGRGSRVPGVTACARVRACSTGMTQSYSRARACVRARRHWRFCSAVGAAGRCWCDSSAQKPRGISGLLCDWCSSRLRWRRHRWCEGCEWCCARDREQTTTTRLVHLIVCCSALLCMCCVRLTLLKTILRAKVRFCFVCCWWCRVGDARMVRRGQRCARWSRAIRECRGEVAK